MLTNLPTIAIERVATSTPFTVRVSVPESGTLAFVAFWQALMYVAPEYVPLATGRVPATA